MNAVELKPIIRKRPDEIAFVVGNGINHHFRNSAHSWMELLRNLWDRFSFHTTSRIPKGISYPEFFDALELQQSNKPGEATELQRVCASEISNWTAKDDQNVFLSGIKELNAPILSTNLDTLMSQTMGLELRRIRPSKFTDYYPWSSYYSDQELSAPNDGFGIWHVNGMVNYPRSLKLGLSDYMGNVHRARQMIVESGGRKQIIRPNWRGKENWLSIFFNRSLFIVGLGLDEQEFFLRWLLIQRQKYFRHHPERRKAGWYVAKSREDGLSEGKSMFLHWVGIEIIEIPEYEEVYEKVWQ
jgi:hypothetical protein